MLFYVEQKPARMVLLNAARPLSPISCIRRGHCQCIRRLPIIITALCNTYKTVLIVFDTLTFVFAVDVANVYVGCVLSLQCFVTRTIQLLLYVIP